MQQSADDESFSIRKRTSSFPFQIMFWLFVSLSFPCLFVLRLPPPNFVPPFSFSSVFLFMVISRSLYICLSLSVSVSLYLSQSLSVNDRFTKLYWTTGEEMKTIHQTILNKRDYDKKWKQFIKLMIMASFIRRFWTNSGGNLQLEPNCRGKKFFSDLIYS